MFDAYDEAMTYLGINELHPLSLVSKAFNAKTSSANWPAHLLDWRSVAGRLHRIQTSRALSRVLLKTDTMAMRSSVRSPGFGTHHNMKWYMRLVDTSLYFDNVDLLTILMWFDDEERKTVAKILLTKLQGDVTYMVATAYKPWRQEWWEKHVSSMPQKDRPDAPVMTLLLEDVNTALREWANAKTSAEDQSRFKYMYPDWMVGIDDYWRLMGGMFIDRHTAEEAYRDEQRKRKSAGSGSAKASSRRSGLRSSNQ